MPFYFTRLCALFALFAFAQFSNVKAQPVSSSLTAEVVPSLSQDWIYSVAVSHDGKYILSGGTDKTLRLWDLSSGRLIRVFTGHTSAVHAVALSADGKYALSGSFDKSVRLWDIATGALLKVLNGHDSFVWSVAFSPNGKQALSSADGLGLWDLESGALIRSFGREHSGHVNAVAISGDGRMAVSGGRDGAILLWDLSTGALAKSIDHITRRDNSPRTVNSVAFSPNNRFVVAGVDDLKLYDLDTGAVRILAPSDVGTVKSAMFSTDGNSIIAAEAWTIYVVDISSGLTRLAIKAHERRDSTQSVAVHPAGGYFISAGTDRSIRVWRTADGELEREIKGNSSPVNSIAFSPRGDTLLVGANDNTVRLFDMLSGRQLRVLVGHRDSINAVSYSSSGSEVLTAARDDYIKSWDPLTGRTLRSIRVPSWNFELGPISPDGSMAISSSEDSLDRRLKLWHLGTGQHIQTLSGGRWALQPSTFAPDGTFVVSETDSDGVSVWDPTTGRQLERYLGHTASISALAVSPNGELIASGSRDRTAVVWARKRPSPQLTRFTGHTDSVTALLFSKDGRTLITGGGDHQIRTWSVHTGLLLSTVSLHKGAVRSIAQSSDGKMIASAGDDGTVKLWTLNSEGIITGLRASIILGPNQQWLTITSDGFFTSSFRDTDMLSVVRGMGASSIGQVRQSLLNPDLVREALAGDPFQEVAIAAKALSLQSVLEAGPPPTAVINSHGVRSTSENELVQVRAQIDDAGKGIGRVEWRVNGATTNVYTPPRDHPPSIIVSHEIALAAGNNDVEIIAYDRNNLISSVPAGVQIMLRGNQASAMPRLHVIAIGIDNYRDKGSASGSYGTFPPLSLAAADALALADALKQSVNTLYGEVLIHTALNEAATPDNLDRIIENVTRDIHPRDTFIFYAAAHGYSKNGRFYLIPQNYQGGADPDALARSAINQERLQMWIAKGSRARRALVLLDTCQSGAVIGGYSRPRLEEAASEAGVGRLHEVTGRPILTAAAPQEFAREGYKGHGVFTYALLEALRSADENQNGIIELTELASHVQKRVPELVSELDKNGGSVKGVALFAIRGSDGDKQSARFGSAGEDFPITSKLP